MEVQSPAPRRSRFNSLVAQPDIDYSMNNPLFADGSNFPCKSYPAGNPVATYQTGQTFQVQMFGSVFHNGGHCQFSLSYNDRDFVVLYTVLKNCFVGTGLTFPVIIPADAPPCDRCTLAWSWVNAMGNRELYMNCIDIAITANSQQQAKAYLEGPKMIVANLPGYPRIEEFPPAPIDGSSLYLAAPTIRISPTAAAVSRSVLPSSSNVVPVSSSSSPSATVAPTRSQNVVSTTSTTSSSSLISSTPAATSSVSVAQPRPTIPTTEPTSTPCSPQFSTKCHETKKDMWAICGSGGVWSYRQCSRGSCQMQNGVASCVV